MSKLYFLSDRLYDDERVALEQISRRINFKDTEEENIAWWGLFKTVTTEWPAPKKELYRRVLQMCLNAYYRGILPDKARGRVEMRMVRKIVHSGIAVTFGEAGRLLESFFPIPPDVPSRDVWMYWPDERKVDAMIAKIKAKT